MIGRSLGSWRIVGRIGAGGMGEVWSAEHQSIGQAAAVKLLLPEVSRDPQAVERFFNEARAASMIRHPGLIRIYDFGHDESGAYIVMERLDGESLRERLDRQGRLSPAEATAIAWQVAGALEATHAAGVVHRDLKPDNLFLVADSEAPRGLRVKVLDFGIAKLGDGAGASIKTRTGTIIGTPAYMSPEQCRDAANVDAASDIYSLGCILFELLAGRPPFIGQGLGEVLGAHIYAEPPPLRSLVPALSPALESQVARMLAKEPGHRPGARELAAGMVPERTAPVAGGRAPPAATAPPGPSRMWPWLAGGVLAIAGVVAAAALGANGAGSEQEAPEVDKPALIPVVVEKPRLHCIHPAGDCETPTVSDFLIDRLEVSRADWQRCVDAGGCEPAGDAGDPRLPQTGVSGAAAEAYCKWIGGRLPTADEWEVAARGADGRIYPWGNEPPTCDRARLSGCGELAPVGAHPAGASPSGVEDLAGNAAEWVSGRLRDRYHVRGGSYSSDAVAARAAVRAHRGGPAPDTGFRCVRDYLAMTPEQRDQLGDLRYGRPRTEPPPVAPVLDVKLSVAVTGAVDKNAEYSERAIASLARNGVRASDTAGVAMAITCAERPHGTYGTTPGVAVGGLAGTAIRCEVKVTAPSLGEPAVLSFEASTPAAVSGSLYRAAIDDLVKDSPWRFMGLFAAVATGRDELAADLARAATFGQRYNVDRAAVRDAVAALIARHAPGDALAAIYLEVDRGDLEACAARGRRCLAIFGEWIEDNPSPFERGRVDPRPLIPLGRDAGPVLAALLTPANTDDRHPGGDPERLAAVIEALAAVGYTEAIEAIERYTADRRPAVARAANEALAALRGR